MSHCSSLIGLRQHFLRANVWRSSKALSANYMRCLGDIVIDADGCRDMAKHNSSLMHSVDVAQHSLLFPNSSQTAPNILTRSLVHDASVCSGEISVIECNKDCSGINGNSCYNMSCRNSSIVSFMCLMSTVISCSTMFLLVIYWIILIIYLVRMWG